MVIWCAVETQLSSTMVLGASVARGFRWFQDVTEAVVGPMGPVLVAIYTILVGTGTYLFCTSWLTSCNGVSDNHATPEPSSEARQYGLSYTYRAGFTGSNVPVFQKASFNHSLVHYLYCTLSPYCGKHGNALLLCSDRITRHCRTRTKCT